MPFDLAVKGGTVTTAEGRFQADLGIAGGKLVAIGSGLEAERSVDATGLKLRGYPVMTISRGEVIVDHGQPRAQPGRGQFLARQKFSWTEAGR